MKVVTQTSPSLVLRPQVLHQSPDPSISGVCRILSVLQELPPGQEGTSGEVTQPGNGSQAPLDLVPHLPLPGTCWTHGLRHHEGRAAGFSEPQFLWPNCLQTDRPLCLVLAFMDAISEGAPQRGPSSQPIICQLQRLPRDSVLRCHDATGLPPLECTQQELFSLRPSGCEP